MERLHIIDGYGYIFRAHYGLAGGGPRLTNSSGEPTGALYVYAQMLLRLHEDVRPDRVVVVFDAPGKSFRHDLDDQYKATRRETPDDLKAQMPLFRPLTEAFSWRVIAVPDVEADDVIATLAHEARERQWEVTIFSADKDLMQLVDEHVEVIDSMRRKKYDREAVEAKFGVGPELVGDWLALVGDSSDNIPGVKGVGKKTAAKLLNDYGSIDGILAHTSELKGKMRERFEDAEQLAQLELSRKLVTLKTDVELDCDLEELRPGPWRGEELRDLLRRFEFTALIERLEGSDAVAVAPRPAADVAVTVASTWDEVAELVAEAAKGDALVIEPISDEERPDRSQSVGLLFAVAGGRAVYAPLRHRYLSAPVQLVVEDVPSSVREALADSGLRKWTHDGKSLRRLLGHAGLDIQGIAFDTMLASYLLDARADCEKLEVVASSYLGQEVPGLAALVGTGKKAARVESIAVETAADYAAHRAQAIASAVPLLRQRLTDAGGLSVLVELELPLAALLADIEERGICLDSPYLHALSDELGKSIGEIETKAFELAGEPFNLASPKQLSRILFDKLELRAPRMKKTKSGTYSTDHETLESMRESHPLVALVLDHRELTKLKGTYVDALPPLVNPSTGRLHTSFRQAVAATGRLSSQEPNLQNIPIRTELGRRIRRAFIASPGRKLVSADYSQIELRILAHLSGDPVLVQAFQNGVDVHSQTAAEVFDIPLDEVDASHRRVAKAVNYGLVYGQSDFGLSRALDIPRGDAKHYIDRYFERFSRVRDFMEEVVDKARAAGAAQTILGRRRPIPDLSSKNFRLRSAAERMAQNTPIQGSAADIMKLAMLKVEPVACEYGAELLLTVHDELVVEAPVEVAEELGARVAEVMASAYELSVPIIVDVGVADDWSAAH